MIGATAAHRVLERVADGTCTQVWTWMTNKYRRSINEGEIYNNRDLTKKRGGGKESKRGTKKEEGREALGRREELGTHILGREVLSPWDI